MCKLVVIRITLCTFVGKRWQPFVRVPVVKSPRPKSTLSDEAMSSLSKSKINEKSVFFLYTSLWKRNRIKAPNYETME